MVEEEARKEGCLGWSGIQSWTGRGRTSVSIEKDKPAIETNENLDAGDSIREGVEHLLAKSRDHQQHLSLPQAQLPSPAGAILTVTNSTDLKVSSEHLPRML